MLWVGVFAYAFGHTVALIEMKRTRHVSICTYTHTELECKLDLQAGEREYIIGETQPDVIGPHVGCGMQLSISDKVLQRDRARQILGLLRVGFLDVDDCLTRVRVSHEEALHMLPLIKAKLLEDAIPISRIDGLTVVAQLAPGFGIL